jgi:arabinogalactan endo-1,4-beta-galactosidase
VVTFAGGRRIAGDVRVTNPVTYEVERGCIKAPGEVVAAAEQAKMVKYLERAREVQYDFLPCVFSSQGEWGSSFRTFFDQLIKYQNRDFSPFSVSNRAYWTRRIAIRLQMGVCSAILAKIRKACYRGWHAGLDGNYLQDIDVQQDMTAKFQFTT